MYTHVKWLRVVCEVMRLRLFLPTTTPSGVAEPSDTDVRLTRKLTDALALIDVRVLDHLVIGQGVQTSLAERGLM